MPGFVSGADERRRHRRKQLRKEKQAQSKDLPNAVLLIPPSNNHTQVLKLNTLAASLQEPQESFLAAFRKRLYRMTIVPSTNLTPDDVLFQTYLMLIFHESHTAFWSHLVFMQMVIVIGMIVLHPFLIALYCAYVWTLNRISLTAFLNWAFLFTITCSDILQGREVVALLAISWARLTLTTHRYEWAACTAAHLSLLHAVAATELVRAFVLNHPFVLLPVLGLFISLSHYYEPLPPRSTRDPNWIHFSDFVAKYGLVAAFVDVGFSCSVVGVVQEVVASFRVLPVFVAKAMLYSGLYDDPQLSRLDKLCKLVTSTKFQSLDFIGLRPDQVAPLSIEEIDSLCNMGPQERVANFRRIISEYCERLSFIKSPDATKALEDFSSALEGYLVDPLFWADVEPLPEPCESVPPTSLSVLPAWSSLWSFLCSRSVPCSGPHAVCCS